MKLVELSEDEIVSRLVKGFPAGKNVRVGIGDDCAVIGSPTDETWQLLKTDCVVEGVHFLPEAAPEKIGWKAMARPLSDIAAMGGVPQYALVTIALSPQTTLQFLQGVYRGLRKAADRFEVAIVGGETAQATPGAMFISVALTGSVERARCVTRSGGRAGDLLFVTGRLGGSIKGRHLTFIPRIEEARWLTSKFSIRAMMDLSDGLAADLPRLARASGVGFVLDEAAVPRTPSCSVEAALKDGEDYELLFCLSPGNAEKLERGWRTRFPKLELTRVGQLSAKVQRALKTHGFDHFKKR